MQLTQFQMPTSSEKQFKLIMLAPLTLAAFVIPFLPMAAADMLLSLSILCILGLGLFNLRAAFLIIIFSRPLLDLTVNRVLFNVNDITVNVLSVFGLTLILLALLLPLQHGFSFKSLRKEPIFYAWILFIVIGFLSIFSSFYLSETVKEILRFLSIFASFIFGVFLFASPQQLERLIKVLIWSALPPVLISLDQIINSSGLPEGTIYRVFGSMTHPNMLAFYLLLPIFLCVFLLLSLKRTRLDVYLYSFLGLFYITILFFTYTRGAYLALLIIFIVVGVVKFKKFLVVGALVLLFAYIVTPSLQERFNSIFQADPYGSLSWRVSLWRDGYNYFLDRPWQGYGLGTAERIVAANRDFRLGSPDPHNDYLRVALDGGILLFIAYLLIGISLIWFAAAAFFKEHRPKLKNFFLFFAAFSLSIYLAAFGDNIINDTALQWHWWALAGAALAVVKRRADFV